MHSLALTSVYQYHCFIVFGAARINLAFHPEYAKCKLELGQFFLLFYVIKHSNMKRFNVCCIKEYNEIYCVQQNKKNGVLISFSMDT